MTAGGRATFRLLGPVAVLDPAGTPVPVGGPRRRALLAALLLHPGTSLPVERLVGMLWPDPPPPTASTMVHGAVAALRRALEPGAPHVLVTREGGYLLDGPARMGGCRPVRGRPGGGAAGACHVAAAGVESAFRGPGRVAGPGAGWGRGAVRAGRCRAVGRGAGAMLRAARRRGAAARPSFHGGRPAGRAGGGASAPGRAVRPSDRRAVPVRPPSSTTASTSLRRAAALVETPPARVPGAHSMLRDEPGEALGIGGRGACSASRRSRSRRADEAAEKRPRHRGGEGPSRDVLRSRGSGRNPRSV